MGRKKEWVNSTPKQRAVYIEQEDYELFCKKTKGSFNKEVNKLIKQKIENGSNR